MIEQDRAWSFDLKHHKLKLPFSLSLQKELWERKLIKLEEAQDFGKYLKKQFSNLVSGLPILFPQTRDGVGVLTLKIVLRLLDV